MKKITIKFATLFIALGIGVGSMGLLSSCGQNGGSDYSSSTRDELTDTSRVEESTVDTTTNENDKTDDQKQMVAVADIVNDFIRDKSYADDFNLALETIAQRKYPNAHILEIEVVTFDTKPNGKIVLDIKMEQNGKELSREITFSGDASSFDKLYGLAANPDAVIDEILRENGLTKADSVEKDSEKESKLKSDLANLNNRQVSQFNTFKNLSTYSFEEKQVQYVAVADIVDEIFGDIDFDKNIKESIEKFYMKGIYGNVNLVFDGCIAFDFNLDENPKFTAFLNVNYINSGYTIGKVNVNVDSEKVGTYLLMSKNANEYINELLKTKDSSINAKVEKNSNEEEKLRQQLQELRTAYFESKGNLEDTTINGNNIGNIFTATIFTDEKMRELGISDYNAFANALLTNKRTQNLEYVTGWTMDDVVATYVNDFTSEGINYSSAVNFLIVTKNGIYNYCLWTQRAMQDNQDRYGMILKDNPNTGLRYTDTKLMTEFSENAIFFDKNGDRMFTEEAQAYDMAFLENSMFSNYDIAPSNFLKEE